MGYQHILFLKFLLIHYKDIPLRRPDRCVERGE